VDSSRVWGTSKVPARGESRLRRKDRRLRRPQEGWGLRHCVLELESNFCLRGETHLFPSGEKASGGHYTVDMGMVFESLRPGKRVRADHNHSC